MSIHLATVLRKKDICAIADMHVACSQDLRKPNKYKSIHRKCAHSTMQFWRK